MGIPLNGAGFTPLLVGVWLLAGLGKYRCLSWALFPHGFHLSLFFVM